VTIEPGKAAALHAKCLVIDAFDLFVSSSNFTEAAQQSNIEVGLRLRSAIVAGPNSPRRRLGNTLPAEGRDDSPAGHKMGVPSCEHRFLSWFS
jgi:phosphatidylserine/phosphatidylglycerophosphate/cardiolipin synthase-like enzyme